MTPTSYLLFKSLLENYYFHHRVQVISVQCREVPDNLKVAASLAVLIHHPQNKSLPNSVFLNDKYTN